VADTNNARVIVYDIATLTDGEAAVKVLGQNTFITSTDFTSQNGMTDPLGVTYDAVDNRLFVSDSGNNRILEFDTTTIVDGQNATHVL
jgi:DNA-binding beta-propeller fold protein YncE